MAKLRFKAIVLDLFDTLVNWNANLLPEMEWHGRRIHSTLPWVLPRIEDALGPVFEREKFLDVYLSVMEEINAEREREGIEITCTERFVRVFERLEVKNNGDLQALARAVTRIHMDGVRSVTSAPPNRVEAVRRLAQTYRLGMLSNFDDSTAGHQIIADTGVRDLFEAIVVSADVGLRKPNPAIFERVTTMLALGADDILFVGDTPAHDVAGSKRAGMHAAWINRHGIALPDGTPAPDIVIADLADLPAVLGC